jgi:hypothetical protein
MADGEHAPQRAHDMKSRASRLDCQVVGVELYSIE